jgi:hypothetical protein
VSGGTLAMARLGAAASGTALNLSNGGTFSFIGAASGTNARALTVNAGGGAINIAGANTRFQLSDRRHQRPLSVSGPVGWRYLEKLRCQ